jgi:hypothetical protein
LTSDVKGFEAILRRPFRVENELDVTRGLPACDDRKIEAPALRQLGLVFTNSICCKSMRLCIPVGFQLAVKRFGCYKLAVGDPGLSRTAGTAASLASKWYWEVHAVLYLYRSQP